MSPASASMRQMWMSCRSGRFLFLSSPAVALPPTPVSSYFVLNPIAHFGFVTLLSKMYKSFVKPPRPAGVLKRIAPVREKVVYGGIFHSDATHAHIFAVVKSNQSDSFFFLGDVFFFNAIRADFCPRFCVVPVQAFVRTCQKDWTFLRVQLDIAQKGNQT